MFSRLLIANRGEIACRIARTAREMGIQTVAVYSDADHSALHVQICDQAIRIGAAPAIDSYLNTNRIIEAAKISGAQAIHPGYGFLSENANFAQQCLDKDINFIGPAPHIIEMMGSKSAARQGMLKAGVPVLAGYDGPDQDDKHLLKQAKSIGFPLLIKAVMGGGGKGLRKVEKANEFSSALAAVRRESQRAFSDDAVLLERFLPIARHIEIQIFADTQGNVVHLFERDCSLQRRHQKVIEESPAPLINTKLLSKLYRAAIECAQAVGYVGAGTVEFLVAPDNTFYFMEMNTRLQVEHPVTEMITGIDLVQWQIRIAAGEKLPLSQSSIHAKGHAVEARLYAENPAREFLPSSGRLHHLKQPQCSEAVRIDTGVQKSDNISAYYDPMIAKLICWAPSRDQAYARLRSCLRHYQLIGPKNNIHFLGQLGAHSKVLAGGVDTRFIENNLQELLDTNTDTPKDAIVCAAIYLIKSRAQQTLNTQTQDADPWSPWAESNGWRIGRHAQASLSLHLANERIEINIETTEKSFQVFLADQSFEVNLLELNSPHLNLSIDGHVRRAVIIEFENVLHVLLDSLQYNFKLIEQIEPGTANKANESDLTSPMPGSVIACHAQPGSKHSQGDILIVVEAMKMEHSIVAANKACVEAVHCKVGDQVEEGDVLLSFVQ